MENKNQSRNIDPQKIRAENLNGRFALVGLIALVGAYITCLLYTSPSPRD